MVFSILLLVILFIFGLINVHFFLPSKKVYAYIHSLFIKTSQATTTTTSDCAREESASSSGTTVSSHKKSQLKSVFATFDKNGDGFITKQELRESLKNIRIIMSEKEVEEMVLKVDSNGDGLIDFEEFCVLCESILKGSDRQGELGSEEEDGTGELELKEAFDVFDKDKDGLISVEELSLVLNCLGIKEGKREEDCKEMIRKVDLDGDGMVNFDEFKRMMRDEGKLVSVH